MDSSSYLYQHLLGPGWDQLAEAVRRAHSCGDVIHAQASGRVLRGQTLLARTLAHVLRMPHESDNSRISLTITRVRQVELWNRSFDGTCLVTTQTGGPERSLIERWGPLEFR